MVTSAVLWKVDGGSSRSTFHNIYYSRYLRFKVRRLTGEQAAPSTHLHRPLSLCHDLEAARSFPADYLSIFLLVVFSEQIIWASVTPWRTSRVPLFRARCPACLFSRTVGASWPTPAGLPSIRRWSSGQRKEFELRRRLEDLAVFYRLKVVERLPL